MVALLVLGGWVLAPLVKPYAVVPLFTERRWRALLLAIVLAAFTLPLLPWATFFQDRSWIADVLTSQNGQNYSAWAIPWLVPITAVALLSLGWRRAGWLAVPSLLPGAHLHYALIALPAISPLLALFFALPALNLPATFALGVIAEAVLVGVRPLVRTWQSRRAIS